ncbi:MAG TPA: hypothetical protein VGW78_00930 [Candidatus Babeliales bacterium]|jgi:hypothetical protein|nr:hypothetical protein [Candidatus Babeliales bacterium]
MKNMVIGILLAYPALNYSMISDESNTFAPKLVYGYNFYTVIVENKTPFPIIIHTKQTLRSMDGLSQEYNVSKTITIKPTCKKDISCATEHVTYGRRLTITENLLTASLLLTEKSKKIEGRNNVHKTLSSQIQIPYKENTSNHIVVDLSDIDKGQSVEQLLYNLSTQGKLSLILQ